MYMVADVRRQTENVPYNQYAHNSRYSYRYEYSKNPRIRIYIFQGYPKQALTYNVNGG